MRRHVTERKSLFIIFSGRQFQELMSTVLLLYERSENQTIENNYLLFVIMIVIVNLIHVSERDCVLFQLQVLSAPAGW